VKTKILDFAISTFSNNPISIYLRIRKMKAVLLVAAFFFLAFSLDNGLGITPPMGWNSWNHFGCNIN
jgi:alpha-galactosidase